jgi:hypothetical protein
MSQPGYWMFETSGVLRPAVMAYLKGDPLSDDQIAALRAYFRQWVKGFHGPEVEELSLDVDGLISRETIDVFCKRCFEIGVDPL